MVLYFKYFKAIILIIDKGLLWELLCTILISRPAGLVAQDGVFLTHDVLQSSEI